MNEQYIQTFGRRRSRRLSGVQTNSLENLYKIYGLDEINENFDLKNCFNTKFDKIIIEIGFGRGEHLINNAIAKPDIGFIGCEPFENGVAVALQSIEKNKLQNVKIFKGDARLLLDSLQNNSIFRVYVLFPDPWTKKKHYKRRLLSVKFLESLREKTEESIIMATDCENYMLNILDNLKNVSGAPIFCDDMNKLCIKPSCMLNTRYEQKALTKGIKCYYLRVR